MACFSPSGTSDTAKGGSRRRMAGGGLAVRDLDKANSWNNPEVENCEIVN